MGVCPHVSTCREARGQAQLSCLWHYLCCFFDTGCLTGLDFSRWAGWLPVSPRRPLVYGSPEPGLQVYATMSGFKVFFFLIYLFIYFTWVLPTKPSPQACYRLSYLSGPIDQFATYRAQCLEQALTRHPKYITKQAHQQIVWFFYEDRQNTSTFSNVPVSQAVFTSSFAFLPNTPNPCQG